MPVRLVEFFPITEASGDADWLRSTQPEAYSSLFFDVGVSLEDGEEDRDRVQFVHDILGMPGDFIVMHVPEPRGPAEPPVYWDGHEWFSQEDDLSPAHERLLRRLRSTMPNLYGLDTIPADG